MPLPISFNSFGDLISAVNLAIRISKALSSSAGSSYEYQYLIQELDALAHVLQLADTATRTGMLQADVVRALVAEIKRCREVMDGLWERIRGYQKALGGSSSKSGATSKAASSWRKIGWALFKTQDVQETRAKLATHRANLTALMTACNLTNIDELKAQTVRFEKTVYMCMRELCNVVSQLPSKIGYTDANAITVVDWRGLETILPVHMVCHSGEQLYAALHTMAYQWPQYMRAIIEETRCYLVSDDTKRAIYDDASFAAACVAGNRIRLITLSGWLVDEWEFKIDESESTPVANVDRYMCEHCTLSSSVPIPGMEGYDTVEIYGSTLETATHVVTTEEVCNENGSVFYAHIYHDPHFSGCPVNHLGVPVTALPLALVLRQSEDSKEDGPQHDMIVVNKEGHEEVMHFYLKDMFPSLALT